jgi:hypothetical protein
MRGSVLPGRQGLEAAAKIQALIYYTFYFLSEFLELAHGELAGTLVPVENGSGNVN